MLKAEEQMEFVVLKKHGESIRGLSRSTGRSRNTVRRYLRGGEGAKTRKPAPAPKWRAPRCPQSTLFGVR